MPDLFPIHPTTGLRALGIVGGRPVWPIAGGDELGANPVLTRLRAAREQQILFVSGLLAQVEAENRDLVAAERSNLTAAQERIGQLDEQIVPLEQFELTAAAHRTAAPGTEGRSGHQGSEQRGAGQGQAQGSSRMTITERQPVHYGTAGEFLADYVRSLNFPDRQADPEAARRVSSLRAWEAQQRVAGAVEAGPHQTTSDTPPLLPNLVVGDILNDLDEARPFVASVGVKTLADRPGLTFQRPYITQHTLVGEQTAEKAELPTRELQMSSIAFTKRTFGGHVNISRQAIDWTDPSAWNAVLADLQTEYGVQTEDTYGAAFAAGVTGTGTVIPYPARGTVEGYVDALYLAASKAATANGTRRATATRFPDHVWTSLDQWASLGSMISKWKLAHPGETEAGTASPTSFSVGSLLDLPRTMVPGFPAGTIVVGRSSLYEFYEERIGLLQAVEPKVLGVDVAYGGYAAGNFLDATAFSKITTATS